MDSVFKKKVDRIQAKYDLSREVLSERLGISVITLIRYYTGERIVRSDVMENLNKLEERLDNNEFLQYANILHYNYFLTIGDISKRLNITQDDYLNYCYGKKVSDQIISQMKEIYIDEKAKSVNKSEINKLDAETVYKREIKFSEAMHRLSKLNIEHQDEVFAIIDLYTAFEKNQEENNVTINLTM